jgi:hypothetical protein
VQAPADQAALAAIWLLARPVLVTDQQNRLYF